MLISTVFIVATHLINACFSTRLPLEVYELTPTNSKHPADATATNVKYKNLEYSTTNFPATSTQSSDITTYAEEHVSSSINGSYNSAEHVALENKSSRERTPIELANPLDRRRPRQMLDSLNTHRAPQNIGNNNAANVATANLFHNNGQNIRILYQVGESEDDLPICAPNAVCSKIDLYEKPWLERQCRCPSINRAPEIRIHHHHRYHSYNRPDRHVLLDAAGFGADTKYENLHLKELMHKLDSVFEDEIDLTPDYVLHEENLALPSTEDDGTLLYGEEINENEFPHLAIKREQQHLHSSPAHMRHSGHMGHHEKLTYIGGCPSGLGIEDGHTIADKTRHYKLCQPIHRLPVCRHFHDYTWTLSTSAGMNSTEQIVHCRCPKNSVTYLTKREPLIEGNGSYKYLFACSPLTRFRCQRKEPCKLFTVRKRQEFIDEVNINALCQCPTGHHCPSRHTQSSVIPGTTFSEDNIQTYSGYCMAND